MISFRTKMFDESAKSHASGNLFVMVGVFIAVFLVIMLLESIVPAVVSIKPMLNEMAESGFLDSDHKLTLSESMSIATVIAGKPSVMIPMLISTVFGTIISIIYCRGFEMRYISSMGVVKKGAVPNYLVGLCIGLALMSAITLLSAAFGVNSIAFQGNINIKILLLYVLGWLIQGMSEEFIFRGYLMTSIGGKHHPAIAVGISSAAFGLAHAVNPGFNPLVLLNLVLFGVFAALYMILTENIWGVSAIHSMWNFSQGNFYGISVSGTGSLVSVFRTTSISDSTLLTGGGFGIEGSIFTTIVLFIGSAIVLWRISRKSVQN